MLHLKINLFILETSPGNNYHHKQSMPVVIQRSRLDEKQLVQFKTRTFYSPEGTLINFH